MKKVAVFLAPGFEECEALMTVDLLRRAQLDTTMFSIHDTDTVTGSHNIIVKTDKKLNELNNELFDCVVLPLLDFPFQLKYRNLLYTAVTRAKKLLIIVGSKKVLEQMAANDRKTLRYTALKALLG